MPFRLPMMLPALFAAAALALLPLDAAAHAYPEKSTPGAGATLIAPPPTVHIEFGSPLEGAFSRIEVTDAQGKSVLAAPSTVAPSNPAVLEAKLKPLAPGRYGVRWSVLGRDGHRTEGRYSFLVAAPSHR